MMISTVLHKFYYINMLFKRQWLCMNIYNATAYSMYITLYTIGILYIVCVYICTNLPWLSQIISLYLRPVFETVSRRRRASALSCSLLWAWLRMSSRVRTPPSSRNSIRYWSLRNINNRKIHNWRNALYKHSILQIVIQYFISLTGLTWKEKSRLLSAGVPSTSQTCIWILCEGLSLRNFS